MKNKKSMCCLFTTLLLFGPRMGILVWWLLDTTRWNVAFDSFIWPLLGFIFLPWTTLMYVVVFAGGVTGFDWLWLGLGLLADILTYAGSGWGNKDKITEYSGGTPETVNVEVSSPE